MTWTALVCGLAALALGLAGCTGGDTPTPPTGTTTSTGSPTVNANIPQAARAHTRAGAVAMAYFFIETADKAYQTNDESVLRSISDPKCIACAGMLEGVAKAKKAGTRQIGPSSEIVGSPPANDPEGGQEKVNLLIQGLPARTVNATGKTVQTTPTDKYIVRVLLSWRTDRWTVDAAGEADL